jgi:hypothetical protein
MSDEQDRAEQLDGDVLGEDPAGDPADGRAVDPADDELPDLDQDGDIGPMSAEDPNVLQADADAPDDERTRAWREEPERGERGDSRDAPGDLSPEEAALHIEGEP